MSNAPSKPVSFSRPKVGYFSNRPRISLRAFCIWCGLCMSGRKLMDPTTYVRHFVQLALLAVPSMKNSLALLPLLEDQPGDRLFALLPVVCVAFVGNYTYSVRLEEIPKRLVKAEGMDMLSRNTSTFPICRKCLRKVRHHSRSIVTSS